MGHIQHYLLLGLQAYFRSFEKQEQLVTIRLQKQLNIIEEETIDLLLNILYMT